MTRTGRLILALALFGLAVAIGLLQPTGLFAPFDLQAMRVVGRLRIAPGAELATAGAELLGRLGAGGGPLLIALALGLFLARGGRAQALIWLIATVAAMMLVDPALTLALTKLRPDAAAPLALASSQGFPSGPAVGAMVLYGAIALLFRKRLVALACAALILATGAGRVWLGAHWTSDVIGSWSAGLSWLTLMSLALPARQTARAARPDPPPPGDSGVP